MAPSIQGVLFMAIEHAASGQVVNILQAAEQPAQARSTAVCKTRDLEVMLMVLPAGRSLPPHHVRGDITVQCLEGEVELLADGEPRLLGPGQFLWLAGGVQYGIKALLDSSLLVTMAMPAADKYDSQPQTA
jgi:quercetin dioxygenase-like cupin family protein